MKRKWNNKWLVGVLVFAACSLSSCMDSDDVGDSYRTFEGQMIADFMAQDSTLTLFTQAMKMTGAYSLMESYGKYTAFIPNNDAIEAWLAENGKSSLSEVESANLREMVYYHLIDGLTNSVSAYRTENFPEGAFGVQNMVGRYLSAHVREGSGRWTIKNGDDYADLLSPNNEMINGVVHVLGEVLAGNNDLLPDYLAHTPKYRIFYEALIATTWADSIKGIEDPTYVAPTTNLPGGNSATPSGAYYGSWPKQKKYLYTCFAESDSIMALREGIHSLDDLRAYAAKVYPECTDPDESSVNNSLHKFIGYHLLDVQESRSKLVISRCYVSSWEWHTWRDYICDKDYRVEMFYIPMQPNTLLNVQNANIVDFDERSAHTIPVLNCPFSAWDPAYSAMTTADEIDGQPIIRIIDSEADQYLQNIVLHGINNMLIYSQEVKANAFHRRIRTDIRTYFTEGVNNGLFFDGDRGYNWFYSSFPDGFCKRFKFVSNSNTYIQSEGRTPHDYFMGDRWYLVGDFDCTLTIGPVPAGRYEVRVGYATQGSGGAVIQAYIDGKPCGIPLDTRVDAYDGDLGWAQDWYALQIAGSSRFANMGESEDDPYGLENDKNLRNHGFMKAPNSYVGWNYHQLGYGESLTARNMPSRLRRILGTYSWTSDGTHELRFLALKKGTLDLDYIEFMPVDLLDEEDQH